MSDHTSIHSQGQKNHTEDKRFCYIRWEAEGRLFANEAKRIPLLRTIGRAAKEEGLSVVAFCILDDSVHLLLYDKTPQKRNVQRKEPHLLQHAEVYPTGEAGRGCLIREESSGWNIGAGQEAARFASDIHMLAIRRDYVKDLNYYWFSSWQSYRGNYEWEFLDMQPLLEGISPDTEEALSRFRRLQKQKAK